WSSRLQPALRPGLLLASLWPGSRLSVVAGCLREELTACVFNPHTLHREPAPPAAYHHQELPFPPPDRHDIPHGTGDLRTSDECLISDCRLDLAEVVRLHVPLLCLRLSEQGMLFFLSVRTGVGADKG